MSVDREQIRRDAEWHDSTAAERRLSAHILALLAELEQAENLARVNAQGFDEHETRADELEARLAKVPALVEALRYISGQDVAGMDAHMQPMEVADAALAAWDAS